MKKSNYVVWPAPSSKCMKMARGPRSLTTPGLILALAGSYLVSRKNCNTSASGSWAVPGLAFLEDHFLSCLFLPRGYSRANVILPRFTL